MLWKMFEKNFMKKLFVIWIFLFLLALVTGCHPNPSNTNNITNPAGPINFHAPSPEQVKQTVWTIQMLASISVGSFMVALGLPNFKTFWVNLVLVIGGAILIVAAVYPQLPF